MKREEVEAWLETEEGKKWLEEKKEPLIKKNEQLLEEVTGIKKRLADATEKGNALEGTINNYLERLKKEFCSNCFDDYSTFKDFLIPNKELREFVLSKIEKLAEADGGLIPSINDTGEFQYSTADGKNFKEYYSEWLKTESAKSFISNPSTGGGAKGSLPTNFDSSFTQNSVKNMSPEEVAKNLDNPTFRNSLTKN